MKRSVKRMFKWCVLCGWEISEDDDYEYEDYDSCGAPYCEGNLKEETAV